jgi:riboflavin kinase/FMN adenylyltransferase
MVIHYGYDNLELKSPVVTMGIFDGVHLGHRSLLDFLLTRAAEEKGDSVVITFHPHPRFVLDKNNKTLTFLSTMDEKIALIEKTGIGHMVIIEFTEEFSRIRACDFVEKILVRKIGTEHLIVGYDHHFGYKGEGDYNTISECALSLNFKVEKVPGLLSGSDSISSSAIRNALIKGNVEEAARLLGYDYFLRGSVVTGKKLGRKLGFPTANIKPDDRFKLVPGDGVYAVDIQIDDRTLAGMLSIGKNPTVNKKPASRSIEVNIFDFDEEIYGREITVLFRYWLRDEVKFGTVEELSHQMEADRINAIRLLA